MTIHDATVYFGFGIAPSMFPAECVIRREPIAPERVAELAELLVPCLNPSHTATIAAMRTKYGIDVPIPATPPVVTLKPGDSVIVMGVSGLPRLQDRHEYTAEEIAQATFSFSCFCVDLLRH